METFDLSDASIAKLAAALRESSMVPPITEIGDADRAGKAFARAFQFNSVANTWHIFTAVPLNGNDRLQVFDVSMSITGIELTPFLCFFNAAPPASIVETVSEGSNPSDSAGLKAFGMREIYVGPNHVLGADENTLPSTFTYKGQSGLGKAGEGIAVVIGSDVVAAAAILRVNATYRRIPGPR